MNRTGTQSRHKKGNNHIGNTQSSLSRYITTKMETAKDFGLTYSPIVQGVTHSVATHSHVTNNGKENFQEQFGVIKHNATYSSSRPWFTGTHSSFASKGITLSHTFSYSKHASITHSVAITHSNTGMIIGSNSKMSFVNPYKGITHSISNNPFTYSATSHNVMAFASHVAGITHSNMKFGSGSTASKFRFYVQSTNNTKNLGTQSFIQFISEINDNAKQMLKTDNISVNGIVVTSATYSLKEGDIVRIGIGHYLHNSDQMVKVK